SAAQRQARGDGAEHHEWQQQLRHGVATQLHQRITQGQRTDAADRQHHRVADDEVPPKLTEADDVLHFAPPAIAATGTFPLRALSPVERSSALRIHCMPKTSSSAPITIRSASSGTNVTSAGPSAATTTASAKKPAPTPIRAERQPRVMPTASTIVSASTISTEQ